jgi:hypothetical protein
LLHRQDLPWPQPITLRGLALGFAEITQE